MFNYNDIIILSSSIIFGFFLILKLKKSQIELNETPEKIKIQNDGTGKRHILGFFQLGIFFEAKKSLDIGEKTHTFIWSRIIEGHLKVVQVFFNYLLFKKFDTYSNNN